MATLHEDLQGVQLKRGPYDPYFNISNLFTQWQTTPKNLPRIQRTRAITFQNKYTFFHC